MSGSIQTISNIPTTNTMTDEIVSPDNETVARLESSASSPEDAEKEPAPTKKEPSMNFRDQLAMRGRVARDKQRRDRQFLLIINVLTTFLFVGALCGWGPLQLMLENNGSFSKSCTAQEAESGTICSDQSAQLVKLGLIIPGMQLTSPVIGVLVDKFGAKNGAYSQAVLALLGLTMLILGTTLMIDSFLVAGCVLLGLQCWLGMQLVIQLGLYFSGHMISRVIFILNTVFDAGSITFLGLWGIQGATGASTPSILGGYLAFGVLLYMLSVTYWAIAVPVHENVAEENAMAVPSTRFSHYEMLVSTRDLKTCLENNISTRILSYEGSQRLLSSLSLHSKKSFTSMELKKGGVDRSTEFRAGKRLSGKPTETLDAGRTDMITDADDDGLYIPVANRQPRAQLISAPYILLTLFFGINVGATNWNLLTQRDFLASLGDDEKNNLYLTIFTLMTPVSILGTPFIDWSILNFGWMVTLQWVNLLAIAFQVIKVASDNLNVQIVGFIIFSFYRAFLFGVSFSFLPSLVSGDVIGTAAGLMYGFGGAMNLCLIPVADVAIQSGSDGLFWANVVMLGLAVPTTLFICILGRYMVFESDAKGADVKDTSEKKLSTTEPVLPGVLENEEIDVTTEAVPAETA